MYKNGVCDLTCNNWECGHDAGDCNDDEIVTECKKGHDNKALTSRPAQVTGVTVMGTNDTSKLADVELTVESADPSKKRAHTPPLPWPQPRRSHAPRCTLAAPRKNASIPMRPTSRA